MNESPLLVTGAAGYIGSHVVRGLCERGFAVTVIDDLSTGDQDALPSNVAFYKGCISETRLLDQVLKGGVRAVLHFAGSVSVPESMFNPSRYYWNNTLNTLHLVEACCRHDVECLVFSSTAAIYGNPERADPVTEQSRINPLNPYGASKAMCERLIVDASRVHGLRYANLRYFNVAGADPEGGLGPQSAEHVPNLVNSLCAALLSESGRFTVYGNDYGTADGTCVRDFIHVSDLAVAHVQVLERLLAGGDSITLNCGYGRGYSVREVLQAGERVAGRRLDVKVAHRRAGDPASVIADVRLLRHVLPWQPRYDDLETMVRHSYQWHARALG